MQARKPVDAFVWRHPLISLAGLILVIGFHLRCHAGDRPGTHRDVHLLPGDPVRFVVHQPTLAVPADLGIGDGDIRDDPGGDPVYRDDTGRTVAEKLAQRARIFPNRLLLGMFVVMFVIINLAYFAYGTGFAIIKWTRTATSVACPWPYPEAKVYDPQGFYELNGQPGPYSVGI